MKLYEEFVARYSQILFDPEEKSFQPIGSRFENGVTWSSRARKEGRRKERERTMEGRERKRKREKEKGQTGDTGAASCNRNDRGASGGHLRHGHFVLSPCSVFTVGQHCEEATYAPLLVLP